MFSGANCSPNTTSQRRHFAPADLRRKLNDVAGMEYILVPAGFETHHPHNACGSASKISAGGFSIPRVCHVPRGSS